MLVLSITCCWFRISGADYPFDKRDFTDAISVLIQRYFITAVVILAFNINNCKTGTLAKMNVPFQRKSSPTYDETFNTIAVELTVRNISTLEHNLINS